MRKYAGVIVLLQLLACTLNEPSVNEVSTSFITLVDSLKFQTGFSFLDRPSGSFYDENIQQTAYYFGNLSTDKELKVFSESGELRYTIPLDSALAKAPIEEVEIWSTDTILALSQYTGQLFFLNSKGELWKEVDLMRFLPRDSIWYNELGSSYFSKMNTSGNSIVLSLNAAVHPRIRSKKGIQYYTEGVWSKAQFVRFDSIFSDQILPSLAFPMYQAIEATDSSLLNIEVKSFVVTEEVIYAHSYYSNRIFKLDAYTLTLLQTFELESDFKKLGERVDTKGKSDAEILTLMKSKKGGGMIARHFFNEWKGHHYFVISIDDQHWALLIYDESLHRIGEQKLSDKEYLPFLLPSRRGLYLQRAATTQFYHNQTLLFHEFTY